jgi:hypothetical protein
MLGLSGQDGFYVTEKEPALVLKILVSVVRFRPKSLTKRQPSPVGVFVFEQEVLVSGLFPVSQ